jgi:hypothetical protein
MKGILAVLPSFACLVAILVLASPRFAGADITRDVATQIYTPEFDDWVLVYTNATLHASCPDYDLGVTKEPTARGVRFQVAGSYANTPSGLNWFRTETSKIRNKLAVMCRNWTKEGFAISPNDFEIDIRMRNTPDHR